MNKRFENARQRVPQPTPPIWMMRQAGRYHRHYQNLRAQHSFMELCKDPELAAQVALGPIEDFDFDVAILFSDLLFPLEALGMGLEYKDTGPELGWSLSQETLSRLVSAKEALSGVAFQKEAVIRTRKLLPQDKSLIGFVGGPWTLFTYAVEGAHKGQLLQAKRNLKLYQQFCQTLVPLLIENIQLQLEGGAEVVMILDTAAGEVSPSIFQRFLVPELKKMAEIFGQKVAYYSKGTTSDHLRAVENLPWGGLGVDHRFEMAQILKTSRSGIRQGNFDQGLLHLEPQDFARELEAFIQPLRELTAEQRAGWVCGLGHGILPKTPEANVRTFVQTIRQEFR